MSRRGRAVPVVAEVEGADVAAAAARVLAALDAIDAALDRAGAPPVRPPVEPELYVPAEVTMVPARGRGALRLVVVREGEGRRREGPRQRDGAPSGL